MKNPECNEKKEINVLLVYPEIPPTYWSFKYALKLIGKRGTIPPLGLLTVASLLPPNYKAKLVDMNVMPLSDKLITMADLVFVSAMIVQQGSFSDLAKRCKDLNVPVVAGGPYPTAFHESMQDVDHFVLNEAEVTLPEFLNDWEKGVARPVYKSRKKPDISLSPTPRFDLLSIDAYASMALQYSRGCPFNCEFCDIIEMFGHRPRIKTDSQIIRELDLLYSLDWRGAVFFVDDNFIGNKRKVKGLLATLAEWQKKRDYPFDFFTEASINLAGDEDLLNLMRAAGFNMVFVGIESPVKETLIETGKNQNIKEDMLESVRKIQGKGIEVTGGFIVGFDSDPDDIFDRQIDFIQASGIPLAMVGLLNALPNTQLYRRLKKEDRLLKESSGNNTHDLQLNFIPKMDLSLVVDGYKHIISNIYAPKKYFERCLTFLRNIEPHQNSSRKVEREELFILFRSLFGQAPSAYGHYYLNFLIKALFTEPKMFPEAVRLAIWGHHFFKITKEILAVDDFKSYAMYIRDTYLEKLREAYAPFDMERAVKDLKAAKDNFLKELKREYQKIDKDFRHMVEEYLNSVENTLVLNYSQWLEGLARG